MFQRLITYLKETKRELTKVNWPTRRATVVSTIVVIVISISVAVYLGALDLLFQFLVKRFVL